LDLEPAQVTLSLVIVEVDRQVVEEGEHLILPERKPCEQVAGGRLWQSSPLTVTTARCRRRIGGQPGGQQVAVAGEQDVALRRAAGTCCATWARTWSAAVRISCSSSSRSLAQAW
jgi:hypothetical protein